jgi:hypothetical protein
MNVAQRHRSGRAAMLGWVGVLVLALSACGPQAGGSTVTPGGNGGGRGATPEGRHDDDSMGSLKERLDGLKTKQSTLVTAATDDAAVCEDLCSLATSICAVQQKLCDLADAHAGDDEYQSLCREAHQECRDAQESCIACVQSNSSP